MHVLQPNQYFGARVFSDAEAAVAHNDDSPYSSFVLDHYPTLQRLGAGLRDDGIDFTDATALFDAVEESIYVDNCCHYNQVGNVLLMDLVFERIEAALRATEGAQRP